jgi:PhzF family phenazine biosynthesis protein
VALDYDHVDVFSPRAYNGNSLAVFRDASALTSSQMLRITQELRHFETIFFEATAQPATVRARVFDLREELPFAGHPLIGGAVVLHQRSGQAGPQAWTVQLPAKTVVVTTARSESGHFRGVLDQGAPEFLGTAGRDDALAAAFGLLPADIRPDLPLQVVSTGLAYLIVPVVSGALGRARIERDITPLLRGVGAQYAVLFDESAVESRHWSNDGTVEDVATGSAAGTIGAYRLRHGLVRGGATFGLNQGRYVGRPSVLHVQPEGTADAVRTVKVGGEVALVGRGTLDALP